MDRKKFESLPVGTIIRDLHCGLTGKVVEHNGSRFLQMPPFTENGGVLTTLAMWNDDAIDTASVELPFRVRIRWGEDPSPEDKFINYGFATEAELSAFLHGVEEAIGWMDYETISPNEDGSWADDAWQAQLKAGDKVKWTETDAEESLFLTVQSVEDVDYENQLVTFLTTEDETITADFAELERVQL